MHSFNTEKSATNASQTPRSTATIPNLNEQAHAVHDYAVDRLSRLTSLTRRAVDIATHITGSVSAPKPKDGAIAGGAGSVGVSGTSALTDVRQNITAIVRPLNDMDIAFGDLEAALNALDEVLGSPID